MSQQNNKKYKWLFLPIESQVRELNGKILLSAIAAERGWGVILGHKSAFSKKLNSLGGVVIEINVSRGYKNNIYSHKLSGRRVCAWCEEGLVYLNSSAYYQRKLDEEVFKMLDMFFLWGDTQRVDILEHINGIQDKLKLTGNPRIDMHRPEIRNYFLPKIKAINNKFGRTILINTNFDRFNHYFGKDWVIPSLREKREIRTEEQEQTQKKLIDYQEQLFNHFNRIVSQISTSFPDHSIIIRPHPSENHEIWKSITSNLNNVHVVHEDDVIPWILASDALIHNSCMTAVQGYLLEKPVISYMPITSKRFDYFLPNVLSFRAKNDDELMKTLENVILNPDYPDSEKEDKLAIAQKYISSLTGRFASDRIIDELEKLKIEPKTLITDKPLERARRFLANLIKFPGKLIAGKKSRFSTRQTQTQKSYTNQKFPGLSLDDVKSAISKFQKTTNRFSRIEVCQLGKNLFCVLPPK